MKKEICITTILILITLGIAYGYNVDQHDIQDWEGITSLKLGITWDSIEEYENAWGKIPDMQHGIVKAGKITETAQLKTIKIYLKDPDGKKVEIIQPRTIHDVTFEPPGCISTGYLELMEVTNETKNGYWKVIWEDNEEEVFSETFLVGEEPEEPEEPEEKERGTKGKTNLTWIGIIIIPVIIILVIVAMRIKSR